MASKPASQSFRTIAARKRPTCQFASSSSRLPVQHFSVTSSRSEAQYENEQAARPRWSYTPQKMTAPYPTQIKDPNKAWQCNNDPAKLDRFYNTFLGRGGDSVLTEEVKWLAITHKSFDQGRRGFNDRLAFFGELRLWFTMKRILSNTGRRILNLQTTLSLLHSPVATQTQSLPDPQDESQPFTHPALDGLANLSDVQITEILTKKRLARLATQMGMPEIMRWKPKDPQNLEGSGIEAVLTTTMYAVVGAIALQKGGDVAAQVTRERILKPLGIS
ncbi:hypothetical protein D0Z07_7510 [Hyphodiscus hymeniophilus]|uniref:RNase III domain-containing protein n=1 Tax=Hyphodiscus hymeniophilus TaxID=353542 RepID=A0A9P7AU60_9HELO|nr:hypothetical protein D0Z07_7510 [Hyphodiscus hymeniophilus]